jgi:hypothetical protein
MADCYDKPATLIMMQGDTWKRRFISKQGSVPLDLNFTEAVFKLKLPYDSSPAIVASSEEGTIIIKPEQGVIDVYIDWRITAELEPVIYIAEIELFFLDGTKESSPMFFVRVLKDPSNFVPNTPVSLVNLGSSGMLKSPRYG